MAHEEAHPGEVLGAVGELGGAAMPEVVGAHAIDFPRGELARLVRAACSLEELRSQVVDTEDEPDVGTRSLEGIARSIGERKPALVADFIDLARDREIGGAGSEVLGASKAANGDGAQCGLPPEDDGIAHAVAFLTGSSPLGELGQILDNGKGFCLIEGDRFHLVSLRLIDGAGHLLTR